MLCNCGSGKKLSTKLVKSSESIIQYLGRFNANPISVEQVDCKSCGRSSIRVFDVLTKRELRRK